jgi:Fe-S oxidoreductase
LYAWPWDMKRDVWAYKECGIEENQWERLELWCLGTDYSTHRKNEDKSPALHPVLMRAFHTCSLPKRWLKNSCFKKLHMWKRFLNPFCVTICWVGVPVMAQWRSALSQFANWNKLFALFPKTWPSSIMTLFNNQMMREAQQKNITSQVELLFSP